MIKQIKQSEKQKSLDALNSQIRACERCRLSVTRKHALTGEGNLNARLLNLNEMKVFPLTHPSALLYNPSFEPETITKYKKLKIFL